MKIVFIVNNLKATNLTVPYKNHSFQSILTLLLLLLIHVLCSTNRWHLKSINKLEMSTEHNRREWTNSKHIIPILLQSLITGKSTADKLYLQ